MGWWMFVSTTVVSVRSFRPGATCAAVALATMREWIAFVVSRFSRAKTRQERAVLRDPGFVEARELAVQEALANLVLQLTEGPVHEVLESAAPEQSIGSDALAARLGRELVAHTKARAHELDQFLVIQLNIEGVELIVLDEGGLLTQGQIQERSLSVDRSNHYRTSIC